MATLKSSPTSNVVAREIALDIALGSFQPDIISHSPGVSAIVVDSLSRRYQPGVQFLHPPATWVGVKPEVWTALLADMGADGTDVPKTVALTTDEEWDALLAEVRIGDNDAKRPLHFMAKMTLRLFMRTARVVAGINDGSSKAPPTAPLAAEGRCSVTKEPRTVKLSQVLDQSSDDLAPALSLEAVKAFNVAYKVIFERPTPPAKEAPWTN